MIEANSSACSEHGSSRLVTSPKPGSASGRSTGSLTKSPRASGSAKMVLGSSPTIPAWLTRLSVAKREVVSTRDGGVDTPALHYFGKIAELHSKINSLLI